MSAPGTRISIVIPAFNEATDLPTLLESLASIRHDPEFEVVVVDNGSTDATAEIARAHGANVVSMKRAKVGAGRNRGAEAARGELLAFLDADVIVTPQWLNEICGVAASLGNVITGDVYDIVEQPSWIERHWFGAFYLRGATSYLNGGNLVISRANFAKVGGFDEQMISGEDVDFCQRATAAGIRVAPNRKLRVLHKGYPSTALQFIRREAWHGRSDFTSMRSFLASPVAIAAAVFAAFHIVLILALIVHYWFTAGIAILAIAGLCLVSALWKWRCVGWKSRLVNAGVFYLYFDGRVLAGWHELVGKLGRSLGFRQA